jgi:hypothetical protein
MRRLAPAVANVAVQRRRGRGKKKEVLVDAGPTLLRLGAGGGWDSIYENDQSDKVLNIEKALALWKVRESMPSTRTYYHASLIALWKVRDSMQRHIIMHLSHSGRCGSMPKHKAHTLKHLSRSGKRAS